MSEKNEPLKVLIVDDNDFLRDSFQTLLERLSNFNFEIRQAASGEAAVEMAKKNNFYYIFTDQHMPPGKTRAEANKLIKEGKPWGKIFGVYQFSEPWLVEDMMRAGANGFLVKNFAATEIAVAIKAVQAGGSYYSRGVKEELERYNSL